MDDSVPEVADLRGELERLARSQVIYERVAEGRRSDFKYALDHGVRLEAVAQATGLDPEAVQAIVAGSDGERLSVAGSVSSSAAAG